MALNDVMNENSFLTGDCIPGLASHFSKKDDWAKAGMLTLAPLSWICLSGSRINHPKLQILSDREDQPAHPH